MDNLAIDYSNPVMLRKAGVVALAKELGPLGMALFLRQFETGYGDYTEERDEWLSKLSLEQIVDALDNM